MTWAVSMEQIHRKIYKAIKRCWEVQQSVHKLDRFTTKLGLEQQDERVLQDYLHRVFEQLNQLETELGFVIDGDEHRPIQARRELDYSPSLSQSWQSVPQSDARFCTQCGQGVGAQARFCGNCGQSVSGPAHLNNGPPPGQHSFEQHPHQSTNLIVEGNIDRGGELNHANRDVNISYGISNVVECSTCRAEGFVTSYQTCTQCGGEGCSTHVLHPNKGDNSEVIEVYGCLQCGGSGMTRMSKGDVESLGYVRGSGYTEVRNQCPTCRGHGKIKL